MRVSGLFSGIGGLERGLQEAGHETLLLCELDPAARAVLQQHFPRVSLHHDVRMLDAIPSDTDLVTAGFPCQDLSPVGRTLGILGSKSNLVGEVFRLLRQRPVEWVLLENVPFMLKLQGGLAMDHVTGALEEIGYRWAYRTIDSRAFGIPHRRARVFILASLSNDPGRVLFSGDESPKALRYELGTPCGFYWTEGNRGLGWAVNAIPTLKGGSGLGIPSPPAIWLSPGAIVTPNLKDAERFQGFEAGWTEVVAGEYSRGHSWRLIGNAVTVPVAKWLGQKLSVYSTANSGYSTVDQIQGWSNAGCGHKGHRFSVKISNWPCGYRIPSLEEFLKFEPSYLSEKATTGFASRLESSHLKYPPEFIESLHSHIQSMRTISFETKRQGRPTPAVKPRSYSQARSSIERDPGASVQ